MFRLVVALVSILLVAAAAPDSDHLPNTKDNRWVYVALSGCQQKGLLEFYDGPKFHVYSTATRSAIADAAVSAFNMLWWQFKDLQRRIDRLSQSKRPMEELRAELEALKLDVARLDAKAPETKGLLRIANVFEPELRSINVDVKAMKTHLDNLIPWHRRDARSMLDAGTCLRFEFFSAATLPLPARPNLKSGRHT